METVVDISPTLTTTTVLLVWMMLSQVGSSFIQELFLHESFDMAGNYLYFRSNVPNATIYNLDEVKVICAKGWWRAYDDFGYLSRSPIAYGNMATSQLVCQNGTFRHKSFRHFASTNTSQNSLSLYAGINYEDQEFFITEMERAAVAPILNGEVDIKEGDEEKDEEKDDDYDNSTTTGSTRHHLLQALVITGTANWTLWEGENFTGKSVCRPGVTEGYFTYSQLRELDMATVQSVRQGCSDLEE